MRPRRRPVTGASDRYARCHPAPDKGAEQPGDRRDHQRQLVGQHHVAECVGVATGVANADSAVGSTSVAPAPPNPSGAGLCVIVAPAPPSARSLGGNVCRAHRGAAPQTRVKAQRRLQQAAEALVQRLLSFALGGNVADPVALQAIRDALARAGLSSENGHRSRSGLVTTGTGFGIATAQSKAVRALSIANRLAELTTPWRIPTRCLRRTTILWSTPRSLTTATS